MGRPALTGTDRRRADRAGRFRIGILDRVNPAGSDGPASNLYSRRDRNAATGRLRNCGPGTSTALGAGCKLATESTGGEPPAETPPAAPPVGTDQDQSERIDDLLNRLTRAQADLANLKRRSGQEVADARQFAVIEFARELLSALDHLDRALTAVPGELTGFTFIEGLFFTRQHFQALLASHGIEAVAGVGQAFDPNFHQAVDTDGSTDPDRVIVVHQPGYRLGDRVVRPALVRVGRQETDADEPEPEAGEPDIDSGDDDG
ncbi:MAG: nucleotide exchange factor GrpE [Chloroflexi bacterium]|nr:nucleotide exchange factor GrpE [Chloroflexota bacterium]